MVEIISYVDPSKQFVELELLCPSKIQFECKRTGVVLSCLEITKVEKNIQQDYFISTNFCLDNLYVSINSPCQECFLSESVEDNGVLMTIFISQVIQ